MLELMMTTNKSLIVTKRVFQEKLQKVDDVALPLHASAVEEDGSVV